MENTTTTEISFQDVKKRTILSLSTRFPLTFINKGLNLLQKIVLMFFLDPQDFGILALASFVLVFAFLPLSGWGANVIQLKEKTDELLTVHTLFQFLITSLIGCIIVFLQGFFVTFFQSFFLGQILLVLITAKAAYSIFSGASLKLTRDIKDYEIMLISFIGTVIQFIATVGLAILGFGFWSLVIGPIPGGFISYTLMLLRSHWKPIKINKEDILLYLKSGSAFSLLAILHTVFTNVDDGIVGKIGGETQLGYYTNGYTFGNLLTITVAHQMHSVMFSSYSRISDLEKLRKMFILVVEFTAMIIIPLTVIGFVYCYEIISSIFQPKWLPLVPIIQGFLIYSAFRGIVGSGGPLLQARGRLKPLILVALIAIGMLVTFGIYLTLMFGIMGIIVVSILLEIFGSVVYIILLKQEININIVREINRVIFATAFMGVLVYAIKLLTEILWPLQIVIALSVYFLIFYIIRKDLIQDFSAIFRLLFNRNQSQNSN